VGFPIDHSAIDAIDANRANDANDANRAFENLTGNAAGNSTHKSAGPWRAEPMSLAQWIAVAGGLGLSPIAPGTFGSAGGALLFVGVLWMGAGDRIVLTGLYLALLGVLFGLGIWASGRAEREWACHDDNRIVIDEVVGQMIALSPLVWLFGDSFVSGSGSLADHQAQAASQAVFSFYFMVVTGFVLFRLFDIWKPGAVRWAERRFKSGLGVMADDVVAGVYSAVVLVLVFFLVFGLFWKVAPSWTEWGGTLSDVGLRSYGLETEGLA
jgi:phosphatidylglycerophosphatase A